MHLRVDSISRSTMQNRMVLIRFLTLRPEAVNGALVSRKQCERMASVAQRVHGGEE